MEKLKDLDRSELETLVESWGERPFRLRDRLRDYEPLDLIKPVNSLAAEDGTIKTLFELGDGLGIESVWMPEDTYAVQCLSTQVGCPLDCTFCATGKMGFKRNLTSGEIIDQVIHFRRQKSTPSLRNLVFMGMGEPLLNTENLVKAIGILSAPDGAGLSETEGIERQIGDIAERSHG
jgi:23S rRNA (adenine2503-C2)-methyltransferase